MGLDEPGVPHAETKIMERESIFHPQASLDGRTSLDQEDNTILLQPDVGVDDAKTTTTNLQADAREEFARPPKKRQQQRVTTSGNEQTKQFDPGGSWSTPFLFKCTSVCLFCFAFLVLCFSVLFLVCKISLVYQVGTRGEEIFPSRIGAIGTRETDG